MPLAITWRGVAALTVVAALWSSQLLRAQTTVLPSQQQSSDFQEASTLFRNGQYEAALERVDAWLKSRPKDARGRFLRGMILTQQKNLDAALRVYTDLSQDFPELPEPYNNLAVIYAERGDLNQARTLLETAVRTNAKFTAAQENLGDVHVRLAAAAYATALKLDAKNLNIAAKLKAVNELVPSAAPAAGKP